jgi:AcrR family transcriptional regulator
MTVTKKAQRESPRRRQILAAARDAFLQFGFAKTSIDDIARRAGISRALVYRTFRNKEALLQGVFDQLFEGRYEKVEKVLAGRGAKREKLLQVCEILCVEPFAEVMSTPMAPELNAACARIDPQGHERRARLRSKHTEALLGSKELADVFTMAIEGLASDTPDEETLRRRIAVLVERFA